MIPSNIIYHDQANSRLTERVPMVCTSSPSSCLVWGIIPPMVTGRQICRYCKNIYQVHKGRLTTFIKEKTQNQEKKKVYISTYILIVLLNFFIVIYYCAYVSSFHTPPFFSISRLLSSRAFWSRDSCPWRLSSSFQQMKDTRKPLWVTYCHITLYLSLSEGAQEK